MEVINSIFNIFGNLFGILLYMMPFWLFDTISNFLNIYSNPLFMWILFIISVFLWTIFIIYFIQLFNISLYKDNTNNIVWGRSSITNENWEIKTEDKIEVWEKTFLSETIRFILWQLNFWTYKDVLVIYFTQVRFKIIPILLIALLLYMPIFWGRGYPTVWNYYFDNKDYIINWIFSFAYSQEENDKVKENLKYSSVWENKEEVKEGAYSNKRYLYQQLSDETWRDKELYNKATNEINIYKNVYDAKSYNDFVNSLNNQISWKEQNIKSLQVRKDTDNLSKKELENVENKIKLLKREVEEAKSQKIAVEEVYNWLWEDFKTNTWLTQVNNLKADKSYYSLEDKIHKDMLNLHSKRTTSAKLTEEYNILSNELNAVINWNSSKTNWSTPFLREVNEYLEKSDSSSWTKRQKLLDILNRVNSSKSYILNPNNINVDSVKQEHDRNLETLKQLNDKLRVWESATNSPKERLKYIISVNENRLKNTDWTNNEKERQYLMLLQYRLLAENDSLNSGTTDVYFFNNKIKFIWKDAFSALWLVTQLIWILFNIFVFLLIIFMAWWKNIYLLYMAFMTWLATTTASFIWEWKNLSRALKAHSERLAEANILNDISWEKDAELRWFEENKDKPETYIIIVIEFFIRLWIIYWLVFLTF